MNKNTDGDMTPFNMQTLPKRPNPLFLPIMWAGSFFASRGHKLKIDKINMRGLRPPYVVLSMHQGFMDYYITPLALFPHRASYVSDMEGFANYGKWLYSQTGCIGTRRFSSDVSLVRNICHVTQENRDIIVLFPEARHSNVGTSSPIPSSVGKLIKMLKLPVVVQKISGSFLSQPIWDEKHVRKAPIKVALEKVLDTDDVLQSNAAEITALLNRHFEYDEYRWQFENRIEIDYPKRAQGLYKMLYRCPNCNAEYQMQSFGDTLRCAACEKEWVMDIYGRLSARTGKTEFVHIPDWYEYQRDCVRTEIESNRYMLQVPVNIDALPNEKGFVSLGGGHLTHTKEGFVLTFNEDAQTLKFSSRIMPSLHIEYDYRDFGDCIVLSTNNCCFYLHGIENELRATKTLLATEVLSELYLKML